MKRYMQSYTAPCMLFKYTIESNTRKDDFPPQDKSLFKHFRLGSSLQDLAHSSRVKHLHTLVQIVSGTYHFIKLVSSIHAPESNRVDWDTVYHVENPISLRVPFARHLPTANPIIKRPIWLSDFQAQVTWLNL